MCVCVLSCSCVRLCVFMCVCVCVTHKERERARERERERERERQRRDTYTHTPALRGSGQARYPHPSASAQQRHRRQRPTWLQRPAPPTRPAGTGESLRTRGGAVAPGAERGVLRCGYRGRRCRAKWRRRVSRGVRAGALPRCIWCACLREMQPPYYVSRIAAGISKRI